MKTEETESSSLKVCMHQLKLQRNYVENSFVNKSFESGLKLIRILTYFEELAKDIFFSVLFFLKNATSINIRYFSCVNLFPELINPTKYLSKLAIIFHIILRILYVHFTAWQRKSHVSIPFRLDTNSKLMIMESEKKKVLPELKSIFADCKSD